MAGAGKSPRPLRRDLWSRIGAAGFLTDDEKRAAVGYGARGGDPGEKAIDPESRVSVTPPTGIGIDVVGPADGGTEPWQNQPRVPAGNPDGGQWTAEGGGLGSTLPFGELSRPSSSAGTIQLAAGFPKEDRGLTVQEFMSKYCRGSIRGKMPSQLLDLTIGELLKLKGDDADTCRKILGRKEYRKP